MSDKEFPYSTVDDFIEKNPVVFFKYICSSSCVFSARHIHGWFLDFHRNKWYFEFPFLDSRPEFSRNVKKIRLPQGGIKVGEEMITKKGRFIFPIELFSNLKLCESSKNITPNRKKPDEVSFETICNLKKELIEGPYRGMGLKHLIREERLCSILRFNTDFNFYEEIILTLDSTSAEKKFRNSATSAEAVYKTFFENERDRLKHEINILLEPYPDGKIKSKTTFDPLSNERLIENFNQDGVLIEIIQSDSKQKITRTNHEYYPSGVLKKTIKAQEFGEQSREQTLFHKNGKIKEKFNFLSGKKFGMQIRYYQNGKIKSERLCEQNYKNGVFLKFFKNGLLTLEYTFFKNGRPSEKASFKNGKKNGKCFSYFESGNLRESINFNKGKKAGNFHKFSESGRILEVGSFVNDFRDGMWEFFHPNGKPSAKGFYFKGKKEGVWEIFYPSGKLFERGSYEKDKPHGVWEGYSRDGSMRYRRSYIKGKEHGTWESYDELGNVSSSLKYDEGKIL